jgi:RNA polymerase sigma factor (sigma-70 family)
MKPEKRLLKYYKSIQRLVRNKAHSYDFDYDEVLQYVLHHLENDDYKKIRAFKDGGPASFETFITTVVVRLIVSFYRQTKSRKNKMEKFGRGLLTMEILGPEKSLLEMEKIRFMETALELLPAQLETLTKEEQRILKMKYLEDLKLSTISRVLHLSRFKTARLLEDAIVKLRRSLDDAIKKSKAPGE